MYTVPFSYPLFSYEKAVSLASDTGVISGDAGPLLETVVEMLRGDSSWRGPALRALYLSAARSLS